MTEKTLKVKLRMDWPSEPNISWCEVTDEESGRNIPVHSVTLRVTAGHTPVVRLELAAPFDITFRGEARALLPESELQYWADRLGFHLVPKNTIVEDELKQ